MPRKPALPPRGATFVAAVNDEFDLGTDEKELLVEVERVLDLLDALHAQVEIDGRFVPGSRGQITVHPAIAEARQSQIVLLRLLGSLGLALAEDEAGRPMPTPAQLRARAGASAKWAKTAAIDARRRARAEGA